MQLAANPEDLLMMRISLEILIYGFLSERLLRIFKRKQQQVMAFRSWDGLDFLCNSLGVIATLCSQSEGLYQRVSAIFDRRDILITS